MLKSVAILLSSLLLFQSAIYYFGSVDDIEKLIEHAELHSEEYGDSFFEFLSKHYGELRLTHSHEDGTEQHDHENLPFNQQVTLQSPVTLTKGLQFEVMLLTPVADSSVNSRYTEYFPSVYTPAVLQPPRQV